MAEAPPQKPPSVLKDVLGMLAVIMVVLGSLAIYSGTWPPAVIVESSSMMHWEDDPGYGNLGTLDPGDLVAVREVDDPSGVSTWAERESRHYGDWGEVVIFRPDGDVSRTPVIHRALAWVEVTHQPETRYHVRWNPAVPCPAEAVPGPEGETCVFGPSGVTIPEVGLEGCTAACDEGLVTKGDNPFTNPVPDPVAGIVDEPVAPDSIVGVARGEIPWLGLAKLAASPSPNEANPPDSYVRVGNAYAPLDAWVMLGASLFVLLVGPLLADEALARLGNQADQDDT